MNYKVSVIIPAYNAERYIETCLNSVLNQTLDCIQVICVNNASQDNTTERLQNYSNLISIIELQENIGSGGARNRGLLEAKGEYIYFLDADDYLEENAIEKLYSAAEEKKVDFICFNSVSFYEDDAPQNVFKRDAIRKKCYPGILLGSSSYIMQMDNNDYFCMPWLFLIKKSFLDFNHLHFEENMYMEDILFSFLIYFYARRTYIIPDILHHYRRHEGSSTYSRDNIKKIEGYIKCYKTVLNISMNEQLSLEQYQMCKNEIRILSSGIQKQIKICEYDELLNIHKGLSSGLYSDMILEMVMCSGWPFLISKQKQEKICQMENLYIYGAGDYAIKVINELERIHAHLQGIIVTSKKNNPDHIYGYKVMELSEIFNKDGCVVIPAVSQIYFDEVVNELCEKKMRVLNLLDDRFE